jgi:hypothetical protein
MKILLASLMCLVLGASQCFAIKGGPQYGGSGSLVGTYAGVMEGEMGSNGLGIFTIGVPQTGLANGLFIIFQEGLFLNGTMQAVADGTKKKITALLHAEATRIEIIDGEVNFTIVAVADGQMRATVSDGNNFSSGRILAGTAVVNEHFPDPISNPPNDQTYQISGFQQSGSPPSG